MNPVSRLLLRFRRRDEKGAALLIALIFVTVFGVVIAALLGFNETDFRLTVATRDQRQIVYDADASIESAINYYRYNRGVTNSPCPPPAPGANTSRTVTVTCNIDYANATPASNAPKVAVALVTSLAEDGLTADSGGTTFIAGGVASNKTIAVSSGAALTVNGYVDAKTGCTNQSQITELNSNIAINCSYNGTPAPDLAADPGAAPFAANYPLGGPALPTAVVDASTIPCPASGAVTMPAGTYNNASALNQLFSGTCANHVFLFSPAAAGVGFYYFDFTDTGSHTWTLSSVDAVGGAIPSGHTAADLSSSCSGATCLPAGQRCDTTALHGVQFAFGGDSQLNVNSGSLELCPEPTPPGGTVQQISIYGVKTDTVSPVNLPPKSSGSAISSTWTTTAGNLPANVTVASSDAIAKTLNVSGYDPLGIAAGSTITAASLVVTHTETSSNMTKFSLPFTVTTTTGTPWSSSLTVGATSATATTQTLSLPASAIGTLAGLNFALSPTIAKQGNSATSGTVLVSQVQLLVTYLGPGGYHAQNGCVILANGCDFLAAGGPGVALSVHGTVYAPLAHGNLHLVGVNYPVMERGVVLRSLRALITQSSACSTLPPPVPAKCFPFQLPVSTTTVSDVVFSASIDGHTRVRAWVNFPSCVGVPLDCNSAIPVVKAWSTVNESGP